MALKVREALDDKMGRVIAVVLVAGFMVLLAISQMHQEQLKRDLDAANRSIADLRVQVSESRLPSQWTFVFGGQTYICSDPGGTGAYACVSS